MYLLLSIIKCERNVKQIELNKKHIVLFIKYETVQCSQYAHKNYVA